MGRRRSSLSGVPQLATTELKLNQGVGYHSVDLALCFPLNSASLMERKQTLYRMRLAYQHCSGFWGFLVCRFCEDGDNRQAWPRVFVISGSICWKELGERIGYEKPLWEADAEPWWVSRGQTKNRRKHLPGRGRWMFECLKEHSVLRECK